MKTKKNLLSTDSTFLTNLDSHARDQGKNVNGVVKPLNRTRVQFFNKYHALRKKYPVVRGHAPAHGGSDEEDLYPKLPGNLLPARPATPHTNFLHEMDLIGIVPLPIFDRIKDGTMNLSGYGLGDCRARALAKSLSFLLRTSHYRP